MIDRSSRWLAAAALWPALAAGCSSKADRRRRRQRRRRGQDRPRRHRQRRSTSACLTDLTGVFAPLGKSVAQGTQLYWKQQNAAGGVCGRTVELTVKDHGYDPQKAVVGLPRDSSRTCSACSSSSARPSSRRCGRRIEPGQRCSSLLAGLVGIAARQRPYIQVIGTTYDIETINGLDFLMRARASSSPATRSATSTSRATSARTR